MDGRSVSAARRVIPCLDIAGDRVVKGVRFERIRSAGAPVEAAQRYESQGADELVVLDIRATAEGRRARAGLIRQIAGTLSIPLTVGGGVRSLEDASGLLRAGADKVAVNTAAVERPPLLTEIAREYGCQCAVLAIDARSTPGGYRVAVRGGQELTDRTVSDWAKEGERRGAGELLVTGIDRDGTRLGYDLDLYAAVRAVTHRPIIASGGFGAPRDVVALFRTGAADAALLASGLHTGRTTVGAVKRALRRAGVPVRPGGR